MKHLIAALMLVQIVTSHPVKEQIKFSIPSEWNLVPDQTGHLRKLHKTEIYLSHFERFFNAETGVRFLLYTNTNPTEAQWFSFNDSLAGSNFNPNVPTRFIIHGWLHSFKSDINRVITANALSVGKFNFIVIDWNAGSGTLNYIIARNRIVDTARVVAQFIDQQVAAGQINFNTLVLIGHSLGAHVCGLVGKRLKSGILPFIYGLDPAGPLFYYKVPKERLDSSDANYVEVIHTAGDFLGIMDPIGDANFYPNGGKSQPGCGSDIFKICAHRRSHELYAESLGGVAEFWAKQCSGFHEIGGNCTASGPSVRMGGEPPNRDNAKGVYYLATGSNPPFALGEHNDVHA